MDMAIYKEVNGVRITIPIAMWSGDEILINLPILYFKDLNQKLYELTGIEEFEINSPNYRCANFINIERTTISSRAKLDLYLWPIKKSIDDYLKEAISKISPKALIDQWFKLDLRSDKNEYFPLSFNDHFIYFLCRINDDERGDLIINQAIKFYLEEIDKGNDFYEEHLQKIRNLKANLNDFESPIFPELSTNLMVLSNESMQNQSSSNQLFIRAYYFTEAFIVTDQIGSTSVEFTKFGLLALTNRNYAFYDIGDDKTVIKKKANNDILKFEKSNFQKSGNFCIGEFEDIEDELIFKQYFFNMHPRNFKKLPNGDLENEGKIFKKTTYS
jgi:hypothetical protein